MGLVCLLVGLKVGRLFEDNDVCVCVVMELWYGGERWWPG